MGIEVQLHPGDEKNISLQSLGIYNSANESPATFSTKLTRPSFELRMVRQNGQSLKMTCGGFDCIDFHTFSISRRPLRELFKFSRSHMLVVARAIGEAGVKAGQANRFGASLRSDNVSRARSHSAKRTCLTRRCEHMVVWQSTPQDARVRHTLAPERLEFNPKVASLQDWKK